MTPLERCTARCQAAGCTVLGAAYVGRQVCVSVRELPVGVETLAQKLGVAFTVSYGDGSGRAQLWFMASEEQEARANGKHLL